MTKLADLKPNPNNPRTASPKKLEMLRKALDEFGDLSCIIYNRKTNRTVGGHQRLKAFAKAKRSEVVVERRYKKPTRTGTIAEGYIKLDGENFGYREVEWDSVFEKAAAIAANRAAGEWDLDELSSWMKEINDFGLDLDLTMFDELERADLLADQGNGTSEGEDADDEFDVEPPKVPKTKPGDLYLLGKHRLICGDSTSPIALGILMNGAKADITFTSPPYNGNTQQMKNGKPVDLYENYKDDLPSDDYVKFAATVLKACIERTSEYVFWNVNYNSNSRAEFIKQIVPFLNLLDETIAWKKTALPVPYGLTRVWEPIFVFRCHNEERRISELKTHETEFNFWDINNTGALDDSHRAAFPVALPGKALDLVKDAESVFDPFGGSGTTMIAAEKRNKACYMVELDPGYCDVIVARWEKFTGKKAVRERAGKDVSKGKDETKLNGAKKVARKTATRGLRAKTAVTSRSLS